jgi:antitoxin HicB
MNELRHYMSLPYRIELIPDEGGVVARIPDLPGCMSSGDTAEEALKGLEEVKELWLQARLKAGHSIPAPTHEASEYSGKFVLRVPKSLHRSLDERANAENMSLNSYLLYLLTERHAEARVSRDVHSLYESVQKAWKVQSEHSGAAYFKRIVRSGKIFKGLESPFANLTFVPSPPKHATVTINKEPTKKDFLN